ncbi:MAG: glycosyltransferase [Opitutaceae bacterium]
MSVGRKRVKCPESPEPFVASIMSSSFPGSLASAPRRRVVSSLVLSRWGPVVPKGGSALRNLQNINALSRLGPVDVISIGLEETAGRFDYVREWKHFNINDLGRRQSSWNRLKACFWRLRFSDHPEFDPYWQDDVVRWLRSRTKPGRYDLAVIAELSLARYFPLLRRTVRRVVYDAHNVESVLIGDLDSRQEQVGASWWRRMSRRVLKRRMMREERRLVEGVDSVWACSESDANSFRELFGTRTPVTVVPNGVDVAAYVPTDGQSKAEGAVVGAAGEASTVGPSDCERSREEFSKHPRGKPLENGGSTSVWTTSAADDTEVVPPANPSRSKLRGVGPEGNQVQTQRTEDRGQATEGSTCDALLATRYSLPATARPAEIDWSSLPATVLYMGSFPYYPNEDAAIRLIRDVMPALRKFDPQARAVIVGRDPTPAMREAAQDDPNITITGAVESIVPFLREPCVVALPIALGGGTRLKILEAFAAGAPVVSSCKGAEGIEAADGVELFLRDEPEDFARAVMNLWCNPALRGRMRAAARQLVSRRYSWNYAADRIGQIVRGFGPSCERRLEVAFIPFNRENRYWSELARHLADESIAVDEVDLRWGLIGRILRGEPVPDILHIQWMPCFDTDAQGIRRLPSFLLYASILRLLGQRLVWTAHDLYTPEAKWRLVDRLFTILATPLLSGIIAHAPSAKRIICREFLIWKRSKVTVIPHGNYIDCYPRTISRAAAREDLGLDQHATVFAFLGHIRPYKGVNELVDAFLSLDGSPAQLVIAGKPLDADTVPALERRIRDRARVRVYPGFIPDERVQVYLNAADVMVIPYKQSLTSGAVVLGMSFGLPCVAAAIGCTPDMLDEAGGFIYHPSNPDGLRDALARALNARERLPAMGRHNLDRAREWTWASVARPTAEVYRTAAGRKGRSRAAVRPQAEAPASPQSNGSTVGSQSI